MSVVSIPCGHCGELSSKSFCSGQCATAWRQPVDSCQGCDLPLSDDVETGDSDYVGGAKLCKECWLEWTGEGDR